MLTGLADAACSPELLLLYSFVCGYLYYENSSAVSYIYCCRDYTAASRYVHISTCVLLLYVLYIHTYMGVLYLSLFLVCSDIPFILCRLTGITTGHNKCFILFSLRGRQKCQLYCYCSLSQDKEGARRADDFVCECDDPNWRVLIFFFYSPVLCFFFFFVNWIAATRQGKGLAHGWTFSRDNIQGNEPRWQVEKKRTKKTPPLLTSFPAV